MVDASRNPMPEPSSNAGVTSPRRPFDFASRDSKGESLGWTESKRALGRALAVWEGLLADNPEGSASGDPLVLTVPRDAVETLGNTVRQLVTAAETKMDRLRAEINQQIRRHESEQAALMRQIQWARDEMAVREQAHQSERKRWENQKQSLNSLVDRLLRELEDENNAAGTPQLIAEMGQLRERCRKLENELEEARKQTLDITAEAERRVLELQVALSERAEELRREREGRERDRQEAERRHAVLQEFVEGLQTRREAQTAQGIDSRATAPGEAARVFEAAMADQDATPRVPPDWSSASESADAARSTAARREVTPWDHLVPDVSSTAKTDSGEVPAIGELGVGSRLGKCLLAHVLGQGGFGVVYLATHLSLNIPVAVKVLRLDAAVGPSQTSRLAEFRREARLLAQLNHPNVVRLWDFDESPPYPHLTMEYVHGPSLAELIRQSGRLSVDRVVELGLQATRGLAAGYELGIIHRDVNPANLLIHRDGTAKLTDFGLARLHDPQERPASGSQGRFDAGRGGAGFGSSRSGSQTLWRGTALYMAPEQASRPHEVDHRADIYALGATLYHAVTGRTPFQGRTPMEVLIEHAHTPPRPPVELVPDLPRGLSDLIVTMLSKRPEDRPQTYDEVEEQLSRFRDAKPLRQSGIEPAVTTPRSSLWRSLMSSRRDTSNRSDWAG